VLSTILRKLGFEIDPAAPEGGVVALDAISEALDHMDPAEARYVAAFAYLLGRVAYADHDLGPAERASIEAMLQERAGLAPDRAVLVTALAGVQILRGRGTQDFLVTREFAAVATPAQKRALVDCLFAVSASDEAIITIEDNEIRRVASEIGLQHAEVVEIRQKYRDRLAVLRRPDGS
jgi:uncharacterized tellurite resistance protein B-like protein